MLTKLYSETNLIDDISFHKGINIILGKYSQNGETRGINGIGKSLIIRLIDFALLSSKAEKVFAQKKYSFLRENEHSISLEFKVGPKTYFLKRFFSNLDTIHFGGSTSKLEEFQKSELNKILEGIFFPTQSKKVFFEGKRYRTLMEFFIKDDLQNQRRIDPLNFFSYNANSREKALYSFYLLNIPTKNIVQFNKASNDYDSKKNILKLLLKSFKPIQAKRLMNFDLKY